MATAPPAAETKKPATPPPAKDDKAKGGDAKAAGGDKGGEKKAAAPSAGQDKKAAGAGGGKTAAPAGGDKAAGGNAGQQRFDRMAVRAKLAVSEPGDAVEREADAVASRVSRKMAEPEQPKKEGGAKGAADPKKEETPKQAVPRMVMRQAESSRSAAAEQRQHAALAEGAAKKDPNDTQERIKQQLGHGEPLPENLKARLEKQLGHDISNVVIHNDGQSDALAKELNAQAFTVGSDIFFAAGKYQPDNPAGMELIAHELAHVIQQKDTGPAVHRRVDPTPASSYVAGSGTPAALDKLSRLQIPAVKARHLPLYTRLAADGNLKRAKGYTRGHPAQRAKWKQQVNVPEQAIRTQLGARQPPIAVPPNSTQKVTLVLGGVPYTNSIAELQDLVKIPKWDKRGRPVANRYEVDHIVELQVSGGHGTGIGNELSNMELLDQPSNSSSGATIMSGIHGNVGDYLATFTPAPDEGQFLRNTDVIFERVVANQASGAPAGASTWWSYDDVVAAEPLAMAQPAPASRDGAPDEFVLSSAPGGAEVGRFRHPASQTVITPTGAAARRLEGMKIISIDASNAGTAGGTSTVQAEWDLPQQWQPANASFTMQLAADGLYRGYPSQIPTPSLVFEHMSPVQISTISLQGGGIVAEGQITPSISLFAAPITVTIEGKDVTFSMDYSPADLNLSVPGVTIDDATVRVFYSTQRGFGVGGQIFYSVPRVGSGDLGATFSQRGGISLEGRFNFDRRLFDRATIRAWWREGDMGAEGEIGIDRPNKIRGVKSATLTAGITNRDWYFRGNAALTLPGVSDASVGVRKTDAGLTIDGDVNLSSSAVVRSGRIHVTAQERAEGWKLTATGSAQPNIPAVDSSLEVNYDDGAFTGTFSGAYTRGMMSGQITVGVTNRSVDEHGNIGALADPDAPLIVYGSGQATLRIAPWLQGTAGIKFAPNGEVTVSGEIGLPGQISLFDRREVNKSLFSLSTQIPIVPGIVAEVGGNLSAKAGIGPGVLDQLRLGIEYNPAHEENTHVTGDAHVNVPADAGLRLAARAGIGLGITGASATGGIELGGSLGIDGAAEAGVHVDWMPSRGLSIDAEAAFHAEPKFKFDISGYVAVTALGFSVYDNRWELAAYEVGSNLRFGIRFPLRYREGEPFSVSLEDVQFEVPDIDPGALIDQVGSAIF